MTTKTTLDFEINAADIEKVEHALGWRLIHQHSQTISKFLDGGEEKQILELETKEKKYVIKSIPELSSEEAELINKVIQEFRELDDEKEIRKRIQPALKDYCKQMLIYLEPEQEKYLLKTIDLLMFEFGILTPLLNDSNLEEITIIGTNKPVYVYDKKYGWLKTNIYFSKEETIKNLINKMGRLIGRTISLQTPKINAMLPDGSRLNACIEPVTISGPSITIRKFKKDPLTPLDLVNFETISVEALAFLWFVLETDCTMLICGNTGSGKTSTLNALFSFVPFDERIIVTEETPEISLCHEHLVKLKVVNSLKIKMSDLIIETLRMRPDRVVIGEIRDRDEVNAFIDTVLAGQGKGSYATFHAQSGLEAITRLKKLGVLEMDLNALDLVVVQRRWNKINSITGEKKEVRKIIEISEVLLEQDKVVLNVLFKYDPVKDCLIKVGDSVNVVEKVLQSFGLSKREFEFRLEKRVEWLEDKCVLNNDLTTFVKLVREAGQNV